jgi:hypothetical protein
MWCLTAEGVAIIIMAFNLSEWEDLNQFLYEDMGL